MSPVMCTIIALSFVLFLGGAALAQSRSEPAACGSLENCDAVIRTSPGLAAYERRGYLHLMQRNLDSAIADFSAAIGIEARAFSLYGRGMARLMSGDAAGQNEMEAAIMLQRDIAEEFEAYAK